MKKRLMSLICAACLLLAAMPSALAADADTRLETVRALGILRGNENGELMLSAPVSRAEFAKMMTAASAYKDSVGKGYGASLFKDVKSSHWASEYIKLAVEQGWFNGYVDGTFRPDSSITLEEGCTALLRLLGYDSGSLTGAFPDAQLSKSASIGLLDDVSAGRGQALTRQDCVTLFYNLLTSSTGSGMVYGATLGYTVTGGEVDYSALVSADLKGPYVAGANGSVSLPFAESGATVYRDGSASSLSQVRQYDVYYYNANLRTVWIYSDRVTGTLTAVSPNRVSPGSVTVAGVSYSIGTSGAVYKLSNKGSFPEGASVTLLLGMSGEVVDVISAQDSQGIYYGVVLSAQQQAASSTGSAGVQTQVKVACSDGLVRTFYQEGSKTFSAGRLVSASVNQGGTTVKALSEKSLTGAFNSSGTRFAGYALADNVEMLDTDGEGGYAKLYPSRLAGAKLEGGDVRYYTLDENGAIDRLILKETTGDTRDYVYVTRAEGRSEGMNLSGSYTYLQNGESRSVSGGTVYSVTAGGAVLLYESGALKSIRQLDSVKLTALTDTYALSGNQRYQLDENVQVLLRGSDGGFYPTSLAEVNDADYTLTGWYDDFGLSAGGRVRILVAS